MPATVDALREAVRAAAAEMRRLQAELDEAKARRDEAIREALSAGADVPDLRADAGLKDRSRIYQIRDGRR